MRPLRLGRDTTALHDIGISDWPKSPQRGVSIIEVMMAATILLVGFIGLLKAVTICSESLDTARKQQVAIQLVAGEMEKLRSGSWSSLTSMPDSGTLTIDASGTPTGDFTSFALTNRTAVLTDDNTTMLGLSRGFTFSFTRTFLRPTGATAGTATYMKVAYTVTWKTNTGRTQRHQIDGYFGKNGLHLSYQQS